MPASQVSNWADADKAGTATPTSIRVGIVDDHSVVRAGLERLFLSHPGFSVVATAGNAKDALALVKSRKLDVMCVSFVGVRLCGLIMAGCNAG